MMISQTQAEAVAAEWIEAWNSHDLSRILSHYTDDFEMSSPMIAIFGGETSGMLKGKTQVGNYWRTALDRYPDLHFTLQEVLHCMTTVVLCYTSTNGRKAAEWLQLNENGKICRAMAHYNQ